MNERVYVAVRKDTNTDIDVFLILKNKVDNEKKLKDEVYKRYGTTNFIEIKIMS